MEWNDSLESMEKFNIFCGIATLVGTVVSIWQAIRAKKSADIAEEAKKAVLTKVRDLDISAFIAESENIQSILSVWTKEKSRGLNYDGDYDKIQKYISNLNSIICKLNDKDNIEKQYRNLTEKIKDFKKPQGSSIESQTMMAANEMLECVRRVVRELHKNISK